MLMGDGEMNKRKNDRRSLALIIALAIALGGGVGAGTYAFFTAVVTSNTNNITAGKLETSINDETIAIGSGGNNISLTNVAPGTTINYTFKVSNGDSTIDQKYKITLINSNSAASNDLISAAVFDITRTNGSDTSTQTGLTYSQFVTNLATVRTLAHGADSNVDTYTVTITIPTSLGNEYQEATGSFQLRVNSTQTGDTSF